MTMAAMMFCFSSKLQNLQQQNQDEREICQQFLDDIVNVVFKKILKLPRSFARTNLEEILI